MKILRARLIAFLIARFPELAYRSEFDAAAKEIRLLQSRLMERGADYKREKAARARLQRAIQKSNQQLRGKQGQVKKMAQELYGDN